MIALMNPRDFGLRASLIGSVLALTSCVYRLPVVTPPSQGLVRIVANAPEHYVVRVNTERVREYEVPHDGRIRVGIPAYQPSCGVYLFNVIKVGGYSDPVKTWTASISRNGSTVLNLSIRDMLRGPMDEAGYHLLKLAD